MSRSSDGQVVWQRCPPQRAGRTDLIPERPTLPRRNSRQPVLHAAAAAVLVSIIAACGSTGADTTPDGATSVLDSARQEGAGPGQIALLEDGDVTYDEYETAMNRAFECMRDAGLAVSVAGTQRQNGTTVISYTVQGTTADTDLAGAAGRSLQDDCYLRDARFVDMFWQTQSPDALAWAGRRAAALEPLLRECLTASGADVSPDASFDELINAASDRTQLDSTSDCMGEIGYSTWDG